MNGSPGDRLAKDIEARAQCMKVRWQFYFTYEDLKFEKVYSYAVTVTPEQAQHFGLARQGLKQK